MASIDEFKAQLIGGGARANQFRITFATPPSVATGLDLRKMSFLVKSTSMPGQTLGEVAVPFRGRTLYLAGDRSYEAWTTSVYNDTDFMVRTGIELWLNALNNETSNTAQVTNPSEYQVDLTIEQLDRSGDTLKTMILTNCFPLSTTAIEFSSDAVTEIESFDISWRFSGYKSSGVSF